MPQPLTLPMLCRSLLAACVFAGILAYASPASAAPLCVEETFFDTGNPDDGTLGDGSICRNFYPGDNAAYYFFDFGTEFEHLLRITVDEVITEFGLTFSRTLLSPDTIFEPFSDFQCVAYGPGGQCVEYSTSLPPVEGVEFSGDVTWLIAWNQPIGTSPIPEILHERGTDSDDLYDEVLQGIFFDPTLGPRDFDCDNPYTATCVEIGIELLAKAPGDPVRAALSDNFSSAVVAQPVPEPGTLALLGLAAGGLALNRRRRSGRARD